MRSIGAAILLGGGIFFAVAALFLPIFVAVAEAFGSDVAFDAPSVRQVGLLLRGFRVAAEATVISQLIGAGLAIGMGHRGRGWIRLATWWLALSTLFTPTYVHAYAWSLLILPAGVATSRAFTGPLQEWLLTEGRAMWCLATWLSPLAAMILLAGWRDSGRYVFQLARLDAGMAVSLRTASRVMFAWVAVSSLICFVVAVTEYSICHLSLCLTWNTEILAQMQDQFVPGGALRLAWPLVAAVLVCLCAVAMLHRWLRRRHGAPEREMQTGNVPESVRLSLFAAVLWTVAAAALLAPGIILAGSLQSGAGFAQLPALYANHASWSGVIALGSVIVSFWISLSWLYLRRVHRGLSARSGRFARVVGALLSLLLTLVVIAQAVMAVSPPALAGDAFAAAYEKIPVLRDHWGIVSLVCAARFSIVATAALWIAAPRQLGEMAQNDGADSWDELWRIQLPGAWKQFLAAALVVFVLSYQEIAATLLVVPPNVGNLPKTLLNAIHFGRNDAVIAMSLSLVFGAACISALVIHLIWRQSRT